MGARGVALASVVVALLGHARTAGGEPRAYVLGDGLRVDPVGATVIEARRPGSRIPVSLASLDDEAGARGAGPIALEALRNEVVAFQVVIDGRGRPVRDLSLLLDRLVGPSTLSVGREIQRFRQWYVRIREPSRHEEARAVTTLADDWFPISRYEARLVHSLGPGWYPDPLIPLDGPVGAVASRRAISIPSEDNPIPSQRAQGFWVEIWVPPDAPSGRYRGTLLVGWDGAVQRREVVLEVLEPAIPDEDHAGLGSISYDFVGVHMASRGTGPLHDLFRLARRHRLTIDALYVHPELREHGIDWSEYDRLYGPLLDGRAFTEAAGYYGPGRGEPVRRFVLPLDWNWPTSPDAPAHEERFVAALRESVEHIRERGWTRTTWHLFVNSTDEPRTVEDFEQIRRYGELSREIRQESRGLVVHRIDAGPFAAIGRELPGWTVERIFDEIGDVVDVWNACGGVSFIPARALARRLQEHPDEQAWFYFSNAAGEPAVGSLLIDGEALGPRTWGWILWRYGLDGAVSWELGVPRSDCIYRPDCSGYGLQGDASLVYLADLIGAPGAVLPSIRLASLRRGAQDYELLRMLARAEGRELADAYARRLVPAALDDGVVEGMDGAWEHDPAAWDEAVSELRGVLAGRVEPPRIEAILNAAPPVVRPWRGVSRRASYLAAAALVALVLAVSLGIGRRR